MQRRFRAATLSENAYGTSYPAPSMRTLDISRLDGGLNLWELDYKLPPNQSPDLLNVYWKDGCISSRPGQEYVSEPDDLGAFHAAYERPWPNDESEFFIVHKGTKLYKVSHLTGAHEEILDDLANSPANFFVFGDSLYYLGSGMYLKITKELTAAPVEPYIPITVMNRNADGTGGNAYQPENRLTGGKRVQFTISPTDQAISFRLPYQGLDPGMIAAKKLVKVTEGSEVRYEWHDATTRMSVNYLDGIISYSAAVYGTTFQDVAEVPNNVEFTVYKTDQDAVDSILNCRCLSVYGSTNELSVVVGGTPKQPNAYFWSGNTSIGLDPTYFPFEYYNFAGSNALEYITGFGRQQSLLIIFKEHSVGKTYFDTVTLNERDMLALRYAQINDAIGCNVPGSIQLIENNLVFANTYGGVYVLNNTSSADENNVVRISRNVNGDPSIRGLLYDLRQGSTSSSVDDNQRYWLVCNGKAYIWDYTIRLSSSDESRLSWFLFDNIGAVAWMSVYDRLLYFRADGALVQFSDLFTDFGNGFMRRYTFATQIFGTYQVLKDVMKVIFAVRTDTNSTVNIMYKTDYEERFDRTPIMAYGWKLAPRNLSFRGLKPIIYATTAVRIPRCFHVRHFSMTLSNDAPYTDMSVVYAQVVYRYVREDR